MLDSLIPTDGRLGREIIWTQLFNLSPWRNKEQKQIRFPAFKRIKCCENNFPIQVHSKEEKMLDQQGWVGISCIDEDPLIYGF